MAQVAQVAPKSAQNGRYKRIVAVGLDDQHKRKREDHRDEATMLFIKQVLCPKPQGSRSIPGPSPHDTGDLPLEDLLPPLTSDNELDIQLYAFIAILLGHFVQSWYSRITDDQHFVNEIVRIVAHCTRGLEQRIRHVDLESVFLDEIPQLIIDHTNGNTTDGMTSPWLA